ncbi:MAG TPA: hypothetical protein PKA53_08375 [Sphingobacterium sp.]|nr:hypothetical protein [Sphingobacterium sp.]
MKAIFSKQAIAITANLTIIQEVLIQYKHICVWEKGFDSFKELHVSPDRTSITHWDIEHDIEYTFNLMEKSDSVLLELKVIDLLGCINFEIMQRYVDTVLVRIKEMCHILQVAVLK